MSRLELEYNSFALREQRKLLRNNMTKAEVYLWNYIQRKQIKGIRFRRQFSIGAFIVDFYAPQIKLAIEVDGATHSTAEEIQFDRFRQSELEKHGITFLRFTNPDIYEALTSVLKKINQKVDDLSKNLH